MAKFVGLNPALTIKQIKNGCGSSRSSHTRQKCVFLCFFVLLEHIANAFVQLHPKLYFIQQLLSVNSGNSPPPRTICANDRCTILGGKLQTEVDGCGQIDWTYGK